MEAAQGWVESCAVTLHVQALDVCTDSTSVWADTIKLCGENQKLSGMGLTGVDGMAKLCEILIAEGKQAASAVRAAEMERVCRKLQ